MTHFTNLDISTIDLRIETRTQVMQRIPLSRATLYRYEDEGKFPPKIKLGDKTGGYLSHEIDYFILAISQGDDLRRVVKSLLHFRSKMIESTPLFQMINYQ
ncbi:helix-turn-helix transcriptional regulator [Vibrio taketomensis]|uniref:helix-turn-helix transcriptional regulator n=1 Tax=Vibrio taketomensis TaxID=2572923 RepID=UPI00138A24FA|nr:AlpA family phage regulatory protein [Vibrio taketomensis]